MSSSFCSWCSWAKWESYADLRFPLFVCGVNKKNEGSRWVQDLLVLPEGCRGFPSVVSRVRWCNLMRVECLLVIKKMMVVFFFYWRLMSRWVVNVSRVVPGQYGFRSWCYSRKWGRGASSRFYLFVFGVNQRFACATTVVESFSSNLFRAIISYWTESYLDFCQTSTMEFFHENSLRQKASPQI